MGSFFGRYLYLRRHWCAEGRWRDRIMIEFSTADLLDQQRCHDFLLEILHPNGFRCPTCQKPISACHVHNRSHAPVLDYRCPCGRIFHLFTKTIWQGTHFSCSTIVSILQGIAQGKSTLHLAKELGLDRSHLLKIRHRIQANAQKALPRGPLPDMTTACDEMFQTASSGNQHKARMYGKHR